MEKLIFNRILAEIVLLVLALLIHDAYFGSLIDLALMGCVIFGVAQRCGYLE